MSTNGEYPPELKTATRAEYVTLVRQARKDQEPKKPGCPLLVLSFLLGVGAVGFGVYYAYTHIVYGALALFLWMFGLSA